MTDKQTQAESGQSNTEKDPEDWVTGDEPMTGAQRSYLTTLSQEAKVEVDENLTKAEASKRIDELQKITGRGTGGGASSQGSERGHASNGSGSASERGGTGDASGAGGGGSKSSGAGNAPPGGGVDDEGGAMATELDFDGNGSRERS